MVPPPVADHARDMTSIAESRALVPSTVSPPSGALPAVVDSHRDDGDMNRAERIGFSLYAAMGIFCAAVLVAAAMTAIVS
jgi:hypothetical protein